MSAEGNDGTWEMPALRGDDFRRFQELIRREAGIILNESKRALLIGRLSRRLKDVGCGTFAEYYEKVTAPGSAELPEMLDRISTNETRFFREPDHFEFLANTLCQRWRARATATGARQVRIWSAACSSGEEPYSLAMTLLACLPPEDGFSVEVLATDISGRMVTRAEAGLWPLEKREQIPESYLKAFMLRGVNAQAGKMKAGPEIRSVVKFFQLNLNGDLWPAVGRFDAIFCRNVMIYFGREERSRLVSRLTNHLGPGGHLFLGHAETLNGLSSPLRPVQPTIYALPNGGAP